MPGASDECNRLMEEFRAYLETLSFIQVDPRLRSEFSLSDIVQNTLLEAWRDLKRIESLDADGRKRWLRKMLVNNLKEEIGARPSPKAATFAGSSRWTPPLRNRRAACKAGWPPRTRRWSNRSCVRKKGCGCWRRWRNLTHGSARRSFSRSITAGR